MAELLKKYIILAIFLALTGCAIQPKIVPINCPAPKIPPEPRYPALSKNASDDKTAKWCIASLKIARGSDKACRMILESYQN